MADVTEIGAARAWSVVCALLLAAAALAFMNRAAEVSDIGPIVSHFAAVNLERRCSEAGEEAISGDPCAVSRGYRFVLHTQGRFDVFRVKDLPLRVVGSGVQGVAWHGSSEETDAIVRAFADEELGP